MKTLFKWFLFLIFTLISGLAIAGYFFVVELNKELPDIEQLNDVQYQTPLSIYTQDGLLIGQFGEKKRMPVKINQVPVRQINAFLAAEDERFYSHPGVDYKGLLRAANRLVKTGKKKTRGQHYHHAGCA